MCGLKPSAASTLGLRHAFAGDRRAAELGRDDRRLGVVEVELQVGDVVGVHVAAEDDQVGCLALDRQPAAAKRWRAAG